MIIFLLTAGADKMQKFKDFKKKYLKFSLPIGALIIIIGILATHRGTISAEIPISSNSGSALANKVLCETPQAARK